MEMCTSKHDPLVLLRVNTDTVSSLAVETLCGTVSMQHKYCLIKIKSTYNMNQQKSESNPDYICFTNK